MDQTTEEMLERQIQTEISNLAIMEDGTEEKSRAIEGLNKLYRLKMEQEKNESDVEIEEIKTNTQTWTDRIKLVLDGAAIVVPIVFYGVWMKRGFEFEKEGYYTSKTFQGLTKFFRPTKK